MYLSPLHHQWTNSLYYQFKFLIGFLIHNTNLQLLQAKIIVLLIITFIMNGIACILEINAKKNKLVE